MQFQRRSSDIISTLPQDIIEKFLTLLPIKDVVRTSVLSKKWRYYWASIPEIEFNDELFEVSSNSKEYKKLKFVNAIFHVLMFHRGPLLRFSLSITELCMDSEIDQIILYLSKNNTLKSFHLWKSLHLENKLANPYKIPSAFSSFQLLEELSLEYCSFELPITFIGFGVLRDLFLFNVRITATILRHLLLNCPRLKKLVLNRCPQDFIEGNKFTFVELCECLPSIVHLEIFGYYVEYLAVGGIQSKLSTSLLHLKSIYLDVFFKDQDELSLLLCIIRSSPNLEKIYIWMCDDEDSLLEQTSMNFIDLQDFSSFNLNSFKELRIDSFRILPPTVDFVKLIMAKSPVLREVRINLDSAVSIDDEVKMHRSLLQHHLARASPSAKFIIQRIFYS